MRHVSDGNTKNDQGNFFIFETQSSTLPTYLPTYLPTRLPNSAKYEMLLPRRLPATTTSNFQETISSPPLYVPCIDRLLETGENTTMVKV